MKVHHLSGYSGTFTEYLEKKYQTSVSQGALDTLLALCDGTYQCVFLPSPIILPPVLQCQNNHSSSALSNACINCEQFQVVKDSFQLIYNHTAPIENPQTSDDSTWNNTFQAFANYKTGFNKSVQEYLDFMDSCSVSISGNNNGNLTFIKTYSTSSDSTRTDLFYDMKRTWEGGFISVGITKKNSEKNDGLVVKKDEYGNVLWARKFGDEGEDVLSRIALTSDSGYIVSGSTDSYRDTTEAWVIKLNADGNVQWSKRYNAGTANGEYGRGIIQTSDGGYALISEYNYAPSYADWAVLKLNTTGNIVWAKRFGSSNSDNAGSLIQDGDSLLVSALAYSTDLDPGIPFSYYNGVVMKIGMNDGSVGWVKSYDIDIKSNWFYDIYKTDSGYILNTIMGDDWYATNPHSTMLRIDKNGNVKKIVRVNSYATSSSGYLSIFPTSDGGFVSAQDNNSANSDIFLQKSDSAGNPVWANKITLPGNQFITRLLENSDGTYAAEGMSDANALLIKTDTLGKTGCHDSTVTITNTFPTYSALNPALAYNNTISISENSTPGTDSLLLLRTTTICATLADNGPHLCGNEQPVFQKLDYQPATCQDLDKIAYTAAEEKWQLYVDSVRNVFDTAYYNKCMGAKNLESFTVTYQTSEYHYTLYYYDQAGNLVKTVPPAGVDDRHGDATFLANVKVKRADELIHGPSAANTLTPDHTLVTEYRYNTLNQVVAQKTPDAGISHFWYDRLGRLVVSQNAKQQPENKYSYTEYDDLGRIVQAGEKPQSTAITQAISRSQTNLYNWLSSTQNKEQITRTVYDVSYYSGDSILIPTLYQRNLRNRVSYTEVFDTEPAGTAPNKWVATHTAATYYSYDIHGNVDTLLQDYNSGAMADAGKRYIKMVYDYDLISSKVNQVAYQPGQADAFYHRYTYDAENRLTDVETSRDKLIWEKDARYYYYKHGPLARTILGQQQVQGIDYAYTLQGWLKAVNSLTALPNSNACPAGTAFDDLTVNDRTQNGTPSTYTAKTSITFEEGFESTDNDDFETVINPDATACDVAGQTLATTDMGNDGSANSPVAKDAYSFALHYFDNAIVHDYSPIGQRQALTSTTPTGFGFTSLFNGNIAAMTVNVPKAGNALLYSYKYDQLNRLVSMDAYKGLNPNTNSWEPIAIDDYKERISYDANGNILTYNRNGDATRESMDALAYSYKANTNQLDKVSDAATDAAAGEYDKYNDIKQGQTNGNYQYDAIGNLIGDVSEGITGIDWNVYGKIKSIAKSGTNISYTYDASGNRISKNANGKETWYVRDASGNLMSIYTKDPSVNAGHLTQSEIDLYGSSRLGIYNLTNDMQSVDGNTGRIYTFTRGNKFFELSNHLGNVLATVDDKKIQHSSDGVTVDYYDAEVVSAQDYYPGGMLMPGRIFNTGNYAYGFNGKRMDNEVSGIGNQLDYGMRIYDPRIGKFLSVDALTKNFPFYSPYHFAGNNPITNIDLDGGEPLDFKDHWKYHNIFNPKTRASNGMNISVDDPKLGHVSVEGVYDNWTKQTWFIHQDNQGNYYYLKNLNGDNQTLSYTSDPSHELVGGQFEKFETQDAFQARLNSQLADGIALFFAGGVTAIAAAPAASLLPSLGEATLAARGTSTLIDYGSQVGGNYIGGQRGADAWINNINGTSLGLSFFNPANGVKSLAFNSITGSAFSATLGEGYNGLGGGKSLSTVSKESVVSFIAGSLTLGTGAKVNQLNGRLKHVQNLFGSSNNPLANSIQRTLTKTETIGNTIGAVSGTAADAINQ